MTDHRALLRKKILAARVASPSLVAGAKRRNGRVVLAYGRDDFVSLALQPNLAAATRRDILAARVASPSLVAGGAVYLSPDVRRFDALVASHQAKGCTDPGCCVCRPTTCGETIIRECDGAECGCR